MATKGEQSRQHILDACRIIILKNGIDKLSHGAIADMLTITKSAVHWHFPTKDDLLRALIEDYLHHLLAEEERHEAPFIKAGLSPEDAVLPGMRLWYLNFRQNRRGWIGIGSQLLSLWSRDQSLVEPIRQWYESPHDTIARSKADTVKGNVAMMVFDGFFNSSKMGVMTLSDEAMDAMQMHVLREAYAAHPEILETIEKVLGEESAAQAG